MAKTTTTHGKKASRSGTSVKRSASTGRFVVGRAAFTSISAVEGITLSRGMRTDLKRTDEMSPSKRRKTLASKYGKK